MRGYFHHLRVVVAILVLVAFLTVISVALFRATEKLAHELGHLGAAGVLLLVCVLVFPALLAWADDGKW